MRWLPVFLLFSLPAFAAGSPATQTAYMTTGPSAEVFDPAPVPDRDIAAPRRPVGQATAQVSPQLFTNPRQYMGAAFPPSSTVQDEQERHMKPAPGVNLSVPLQ